MKEAYISGAICGHMWWPQSIGGKPIKINLDGFFRRLGPGAKFSDVLDSILFHEGGDFQDAKFSADTEIVIKRQKSLAPYVWQTRVKIRELAEVPALSHFVNQEVYTCDFFYEED